MKKGICLSILLILVMSSCANRSAGAYINSGGHKSGFIRGDVLKF